MVLMRPVACSVKRSRALARRGAEAFVEAAHVSEGEATGREQSRFEVLECVEHVRGQ